MSFASKFSSSPIYKSKCDEPWAVFSAKEVRDAFKPIFLYPPKYDHAVAHSLALDLSKEIGLCCGVEAFAKQGKQPKEVYLIVSKTNEDYVVARLHVREEFLKTHGGNMTGDQLVIVR